MVKDFAAFIIKNNRSNIVMIILFACLVGWLNSSLVEMKKEIRHNLKKTSWAGMNTGMDMQVHVQM